MVMVIRVLGLDAFWVCIYKEMPIHRIKCVEYSKLRRYIVYTYFISLFIIESKH